MQVSFEAEYSLGATVYLTTDPEDLRRIVLAYTFDIEGTVKYIISDSEHEHYSIELSSQNRNLRGDN